MPRCGLDLHASPQVRAPGIGGDAPMEVFDTKPAMGGDAPMEVFDTKLAMGGDAPKLRQWPQTEKFPFQPVLLFTFVRSFPYLWK